MDFGAIYAETKGRITELTGGLSQDQLERDVPATPEWCVRDAVAHLVGVAGDVQAGNRRGAAGGEAGTAAQVDARRGSSIAEVLDEWGKVAPGLEAAISAAGTAMGFLIADIAEHE